MRTAAVQQSTVRAHGVVGLSSRHLVASRSPLHNKGSSRKVVCSASGPSAPATPTPRVSATVRVVSWCFRWALQNPWDGASMMVCFACIMFNHRTWLWMHASAVQLSTALNVLGAAESRQLLAWIWLAVFVVRHALKAAEKWCAVPDKVANIERMLTEINNGSTKRS